MKKEVEGEYQNEKENELKVTQREEKRGMGKVSV